MIGLILGYKRVLSGDLHRCNPLQRRKAQKALLTRFCGQHFFKKTMVNSVHIWSVDLVCVEEDAPGSSLFKSQYKIMLCLSANHATSLGVFLPHPCTRHSSCFDLRKQESCMFGDSTFCHRVCSINGCDEEAPLRSWIGDG